MYTVIACLCHIPNLQTVVQPVRIEEHAIVHLPMLTATVPVGTQEITARPEVSICANTDNRWSKKGTIGPFVFADCSPACQNGGTCHRSSSDAYCDCPSGYTGSYCQNRGMHCCTHNHAAKKQLVHEACTCVQYVCTSVSYCRL